MSPRWLIGMAVAAFAGVAAVATSTLTMPGAKAAPGFSTDTEKASYALGVSLARQLKLVAKDLDADALAAGFIDAADDDGTVRLTTEEVRTTLMTLRAAYQKKVAAARASAGAPATATKGISVYFKDAQSPNGPATRARWVSPRTYSSAGDAKQVVIEARAQALTDKGQMKAITPTWKASDPSMVEVTPEKGAAVTITIKRPGTSAIHLSADGMTTAVAVKAETNNTVLRADISQQH